MFSMLKKSNLYFFVHIYFSKRERFLIIIVKLVNMVIKSIYIHIREHDFMRYFNEWNLEKMKQAWIYFLISRVY